jgi:sulfate adenylyltransferase
MLQDTLTAPHGGTLVNLLVEPARAAELQTASQTWPSWDLTPRQLCDLELLLNGGFSPLAGFMTRADYEPVCRDMRLASGVLWPMPITLDVPEAFAATLAPGATVALRDAEGVMLAALHVEDVWSPDREAEAQAVFGTTNREHPGVAALLDRTNSHYVGGRLEGLHLPVHYDFKPLRQTPAELREAFARRGWTRVVAFQTRNPMHRAHQELTLRAAREATRTSSIHPVVGMTKPGDVDHYTRVRCYQAVLDSYPADTAALSLLPLAMRMGGPREAVWHAIIRKNYGCTHFIVGRDHAGPGKDSSGTPFYGPYDAQELMRPTSRRSAWSWSRSATWSTSRIGAYFPEDEVPAGADRPRHLGHRAAPALADRPAHPEWFTFPAVVDVLRETHPPRSKQGFTVFFTGLSGSGKSTIANALLVKLLEMGGRPVTLLDGDHVRKHLSSELGFSKEHRDINIRRIGYVASEITKNGGIAICAPIAPYDATRKDVRGMIEPFGGFVLVHVATSLEECERRDRKGLYAKARAGILKEFTGISDPYEAPADAVLRTEGTSPEEEADAIVAWLRREGFLS